MIHWIYVQYSDEKRKFTQEVEMIINTNVLSNKDRLTAIILKSISSIDSANVSVSINAVNVTTISKIDNEETNSFNNISSATNDSKIFIDFKNFDQLNQIIDSAIFANFQHYLENQLQLDKNISINNVNNLLLNVPLIGINIDGYNMYLVKKIIYHIILALVILLIIITTFFLLYKNLVKQALFGIEKDNMISNLSHELKTPVSTTKVILEALSNYNGLEDLEKTKKYISIAHYEMDKLERLIERAMLIMTSENGKLELKLKKTSLKDKFENIIENFTIKLKDKQAKIYFQQYCPDYHVYIDDLHFENSIINIIDNALKYGGTSIEIYINETIDNNIVILIKDNGIGIPEEYRYKIFDKFFRVPNGDKHEVKGHGLGLNYTKKIIEAHNGSIYLDNSKATCFVIILPKII